LADEVADELAMPFENISTEMVFRGLYHFAIAHHQGLATDPVTLTA
ncbi:MAG: IS4 family transposase, partial [Moorea sp. SIO4G2]|nr:IS4 family transposase [Moorena sp. SIO4G2]